MYQYKSLLLRKRFFLGTLITVAETRPGVVIVCSTGEDSWGNATEKKSAGKCAEIGEGTEKNRHWARILSYRCV
ncbi:hypothetical protein Y032_0012g1829 [Ancylostoma ceylanicum]|uniref:Uncharacterized protein n=1 Tax=Ancylostoma ceylanicum TaxID=53326 RepID=A0A016VF10_9BILA|nr:hypothetical protein Y032_0012g1829 [Ancylostoma ceylanicum]